MQKPYDAAEYRHRAAGARVRAGQMPNERGKAVMRRIAEEYEQMAELRARYEKNKPPAAEQSPDAH